MKTKKLFLKLFLAAFFLAVFVPKDVHAAQIKISVQDAPGDILISGTNSTDYKVTSNGRELAPNNKDGYILTGRASNKKIIVDVPGTTLNLTFLDLLMENPGSSNQLDIQNGIVHINLQNDKSDRNMLKNFNGPAVLINGSSRLKFEGGGKISLSGTTHAVDGGTTGDLEVACTGNGAVTLNVQNTGKGVSPFHGDELTATSGLLRFEGPDGNTVAFGDRILYLDGAKVEAEGIVEISYKDESLINLTPDAHTLTYNRDSGTSSSITDNADASGKFYLKEEYPIFGRYITIDGAQRIFLDKRPAAPTNIKFKSEEIAYTDEGSITLPSLDYQYMGADGNQPSTWKTPDDPVITGLSPGKYLVRQKSTNTQFASESTIVTLNKGRILTITPPTFSEITYGDPQPNLDYFKIKNHDRQQITITSIKQVSGDSKWYTLPANSDTLNISIGSEGQNDNAISLQPNSPLDAKSSSYKTTFEIRYRTADDPDTVKKEQASVEFKVNPKKQPKPDTTGFTLVKATYNSVVISPATPPADVDTGIEYGIKEAVDDKDIQKWITPKAGENPTFTGLSGNTDYIIQARCKGKSPNYIASDPIEIPVLTETAATLDYKNEKIQMPPYADRDYTITIGNEKVTAKGGDKIDIKETWFDKDVLIHDDTNNYDQTLHIRKRDKAPSGFKATEETIASYHDGKISGVGPAMEYKKDTWDSWEPCTGPTIEKNTITQLEPGTYFIRNAATDEKFASASSEPIVVKKGKVINVEVDPFEPMVYGNTPDAKEIKITNYDKKNNVTIEGMSVDPQMFVISEGDKTVEADGELFNWKIQPKEKLNVGTYNAELIVSYNNSASTTPDEPTDPDNPDNPTNPDNPDNPTNPDNPDNPTNPDNPDNPTNPDNPDNPTEPETPDENENGNDTPTTKAQATDEAENDSTDNPDGEKLEPFAVPVEITVTKATQDPPPVPAEKSKTATSITLETIPNSPISGAKAQYSKDSGKTWQDSPTFTGLSANREYTFVARYAETENYEASEISAGEIAITTAEKNDDDSSVKPNANDNNSNGSNGSNNGTNGNGTNGNGTNGTNGTSGSGNGTDGSNGVLSSAKTGDMNNISLWASLLIISYISSAILIKGRMKKSKA